MSATPLKVFITRHIKETDLFKTTLEKVGFAVFGQSLIEFSAVPFDLDANVDWLFFYSKNGIRFFFNQLDSSDLSLLSNKKIATIGQGTAQYLTQHYQRQPDFVGNGEPLETARAFAQIAAGKRVIFPRAKSSQQSIQKQLSTVVNAVDVIVYDNTPKTDFTLPEVDIVVFTSPINARVYFSKYDTASARKVVAIGHTTARELQKIGLNNVVIAKNPSEQGLADAVIALGF